ncbi:nicotinamide/nicotinic acid mononucleotide adenylyltransferase 1-like isoform X1 [Octopus vulgaris]|uniref:Nicotinamide-nucleotide adenylyltransferase n=1 Tax=Octopus vulgaris TaxID=6645 RepID=A0AA36BFD4_OCTVU|nr:nicotinamide/nicotinic acid mononucleotide adenylyltransferase 1-like isoform X1 [Octopus vulgaris]
MAKVPQLGANMNTAVRHFCSTTVNAKRHIKTMYRTKMPQVVLLSCGSYNPITNMHLRMFELARDNLQRNGRYNVIGGIVSPVNDNYGKKDLISSYHRCKMVEKSLESSDWIILDRWESDLNCWTETRHVLAYHSNRLNSSETTNHIGDENQNPNAILVKLLCGADLLESFGVPNLWRKEHIEEIVGKYGLVCISRAGSDPYKFIYESDVLTKYQDNITIVTEWLSNEISSTKIRRAIRRGESVKYLVQDAVIDYIIKEKLYTSEDNKYHSLLSPGTTRSLTSTSTYLTSYIDFQEHIHLTPLT